MSPSPAAAAGMYPSYWPPPVRGRRARGAGPGRERGGDSVKAGFQGAGTRLSSLAGRAGGAGAAGAVLVRVAVAVAVGGGLVLLRLLDHQGLGGQEHAGDGRRVLHGRPGDLHRVDDALGGQVAVLAG